MIRNEGDTSSLAVTGGIGTHCCSRHTDGIRVNSCPHSSPALLAQSATVHTGPQHVFSWLSCFHTKARSRPGKPMSVLIILVVTAPMSVSLLLRSLPLCFFSSFHLPSSSDFHVHRPPGSCAHDFWGCEVMRAEEASPLPRQKDSRHIDNKTYVLLKEVKKRRQRAVGVKALATLQATAPYLFPVVTRAFRRHRSDA